MNNYADIPRKKTRRYAVSQKVYSFTQPIHYSGCIFAGKLEGKFTQKKSFHESKSSHGFYLLEWGALEWGPEDRVVGFPDGRDCDFGEKLRIFTLLACVHFVTPGDFALLCRRPKAQDNVLKWSISQRFEGRRRRKTMWPSRTQV